MSENPFRIHAGLPALGGVEWLEAMASKLETCPASSIGPAYLANGLREVSAIIRRSVLAPDAETRPSPDRPVVPEERSDG